MTWTVQQQGAAGSCMYAMHGICIRPLISPESVTQWLSPCDTPAAAQKVVSTMKRLLDEQANLPSRPAAVPVSSVCACRERRVFILDTTTGKIVTNARLPEPKVCLPLGRSRSAVVQFVLHWPELVFAQRRLVCCNWQVQRLCAPSLKAE